MAVLKCLAVLQDYVAIQSCPVHPAPHVAQLQVASDMRAQLAEQEAAAEALLAEKEAAEEVAEQLWLQLQAVQEQAVEALQQLEDADAHKARLQQVGGGGQGSQRSGC